MYELEILRSPDAGAGGSGGSEGGGTPPPGETPAPQTTPTGGGGDDQGHLGEKKFTQAEVDRMMGERAKRAGESAIGELLKGLGLEKPEDLKAIVGEHKKLKDSQLSDLEKANKRVAELEPKLSDYETELADLRLQRALGKALQQQKLSFASDAAEEDVLEHLSRVVQLDAKGVPKNLDDAIKALMKDRPYLFGKSGDGMNINALNRGDRQTVVSDENEKALKNRFGIKS